MNSNNIPSNINPSTFKFNPRDGLYFDISESINEKKSCPAISSDNLSLFEELDLIFRTLCGALYNFVPTSGHPGGSISSGRFVSNIVYNSLAYDFSNPHNEMNDTIVYAAGHKALGLYSMLALRNELVRISKPGLLPKDERLQLRFEDLLGFRRNPITGTPLFNKFRAKPLDGHPTPSIPFVSFATGASGIGAAASFGLALGALDRFGENAPKIHVVEGEGGMTPGRVHEAMAAASYARLYNLVMHVDFNQASIESNHVCRDGAGPGDYVQWTPAELGFLHDWNVIKVPDGMDFQQISAAQSLAGKITNKRPTMIVYSTIKGWKYGMEGKASHGSGHKFCSEGYYTHSIKEFEDHFGVHLPRFCVEPTPENIEREYYSTLMEIRGVLEKRKDITEFFASQVADASARLKSLGRKPRDNAPNMEIIYTDSLNADDVPEKLRFKPGASTTIRGALGESLRVVNVKSGGAIFAAAADLLGSTSINAISKGFPEGYYNSISNTGARMVSMGGICEDAMGAFMAGLSSFGKNIGVSSSYCAFIASMEHTAARLHGIGMQAREHSFGLPYNTWVMINAHAGVKTGEDGPTHADSQALQLLQGNFPKGVMITLTPWTPDEVWPLFIAGIKARPAILAPFVTRPNEKIVDRTALGLPPANATVKGLYYLHKADRNRKPFHGTVILQESGVATAFVSVVLPRIISEKLNINVLYISSAELFDMLPEAERLGIFNEDMAKEAMGITGFTLPTMHRWILNSSGLKRTLYPYINGRYLGSGPAEKVLEEAGLDGESQWKAVKAYAEEMSSR